jgi:hypothetical protein
MKATKQEQQAAIERLKSWVMPGDTIYCVLAHKSASGMQRIIRFYKITSSNESGKQETWELSFNIAKALEYGYNDKREGVTVNGCGMDMGFHVVYSLSDKLFGNGYLLHSSWL